MLGWRAPRSGPENGCYQGWSHERPSLTKSELWTPGYHQKDIIASMYREQYLTHSGCTDMDRSWQVLLIGGGSGTGKTSIVEQLGRRLGLPWIQVDDLRLTLQFGALVDPEVHGDLFYFLRLTDPQSVPVDELLAKLISISRLLAPAVEVVIDHHVSTNTPIIIEGDGLDPALIARRLGPGVRAFILDAGSEEHVTENLIEREQGEHSRSGDQPLSDQAHEAWTRLAWHYHQWLVQEAQRFGIPILPAFPRNNLADRALAITSNQ